MNCYSFEELYVGQEEHFEVKITERMIENFRETTGDINPLHNDKAFAKERHFPDRVVYGMLTASFISTLGGVYLPGKYCLIQSVETKFLKPVFPEDVLTVSGVVSEIHETVRQVEIKVVMTNQKNEKILRGKLKVGLLDE